MQSWFRGDPFEETTRRRRKWLDSQISCSHITKMKNESLQMQSGTGNVALTVQSGCENTAMSFQSGSGNTSHIFQTN